MRRTQLNILVLSLVMLSLGCREVGMMGYLLSPRQIQKPHYVLTEERVALVIDPPATSELHPLFSRALHRKMLSLFKELEVKTKLVPFDQTLRVQQEPEYRNWTVQRIGQKLRAKEVIYVQMTEFAMRESRDHPILSPSAKMRVKVIDTDADPAEARRWPDGIEGYLIEITRRPSEFGSMRDLDREAEKLGRDTAQYIARLFAEWDQEENIPVEK